MRLLFAQVTGASAGVARRAVDAVLPARGSELAPWASATAVVGLRLCGSTEAGVVERVRAKWEQGGWIITANVDVLRMVGRDPDLRRLGDNAIVVADGMPVVWASRLAGMDVPERVTGSSLILSLSAAAAKDGRSVYLLGGDPGIPERAATSLLEREPGLRVVGTDSPPYGFDRSPAAFRQVLERVGVAAPDLVMVGLGFPRQERLIEALRPLLPSTWFLGCGAGIAMAAGQFPRADPVLQRAGLEWAHRLRLEPRRLARRYLREDMPFALKLLVHGAVHRARGAAVAGAGRGTV